jgi:tRNA threonylcarbamoyladenosine biosynthesis protein TsaB
MNLLAVDTATEKFSVAVSSGNDTWLFEADAGLRHSELVMDSIDMLMHTAGLGPEDLYGIVCMGGPGSFTGLRIGFSIAKGLALSLNIPFAAIPTLECMARPFAAWPGITAPVLDAKKGAFFCALYHGGKQLCPVMDSSPAEIARAIADAQIAGGHLCYGHLCPTLLTGPAAPLLGEKLAALGVTDINHGKGPRWGNAETLLFIAREKGINFCNTDCNTDYDSGPEYKRGAI